MERGSTEIDLYRCAVMMTEETRQRKRLKTFYEGHQYLIWRETMLGPYIPGFLRKLVPVKWLGSWVAK